MIDQFGKCVYECDPSAWENWYGEIYVRHGQKCRAIVPPWHKSVVEQWTGLPSGLAKKMNCPEYLRDDFEAEGLRRLCEIAGKYNPRRSQFQTIAWLSLWRHLSRWLMLERRRVQTVSIYDHVVVDTKESTTEERIRVIRSQIKEMSRWSDKVDMELVSEYYGINGTSPKTLKEIAGKRRLTQERVRQRIARGIRSMRHAANQCA